MIELRNSGKSHTLVFMGHDSRNTSDDLVARFLEAYGTPNYIKFDPWAALNKAYQLTQGIDDLLAPDLDETRYVLSFGADFLNNWPTSMGNQRIYGEKRSKRAIKIVQIEPRFSICAARADRWVPLNLGTEGLLALGIASIIIREKLYDQEFIEKSAFRFEDFVDRSGQTQIGFKNLILRDVRLDRISDLTGVPLRSIIELANDFSLIKPSIALGDYGLSYHSNGVFNALAIHSLNALVGNIDAPGGCLRQRRAPLKELPPPILDATAQKGLSQPRIDGLSAEEGNGRGFRVKDFVRNVMTGHPYEVNCLFLSSNSQFFPSLISRKINEIAHKIPFIVSFASFRDEMNSFADLILPDVTLFEKWQENQAPLLNKIPIVGVNQPVIKPRDQCRPFEDTVINLAKKTGSSVARNFPWAGFKELLLDRLEGLFAQKRGSVFTSPYEESELRLLEERGWWQSEHESYSSFLKDLMEKGGWLDPVYHFGERSFLYQNSSRKFEFFSSLDLKNMGPRFSGDPDQYPFFLYLYDLPFTSDDNGENMPWFQEALGFRFKSEWEAWVELNPQTAREYLIRDNEIIWVESPTGRIKARAKIFPGIMPRVIGLPLGKAEETPGMKKSKKRDHPLALIGEDYDEMTGMPSRFSTRVKIYKA